ncbi:membrane protein insertase YidC [Meridianimarinicoccus aquatilis]|uniref:Membrane protein insertase YidC n=1 Tax=Meridianimarinicoccus aquatilis TaxID=2552766 RepID=A0A4R6AWE0_9RHOB|nr:membrane protein insertase YidC [Fluviibacterium aquatile]QIE41360.1 membrane protein insertase YidC [Rhodobacteraceae bacterium SC52]TDL87128.1 membrane protein insertase YidC [Fluviibacterium aquatile]
MDDQNKNMILATALSFLVILGWFLLFPPEEPPAPAEQPVAEIGGDPATADVAAAPPAPDATATLPVESRDVALSAASRVQIRTDEVTGSISLTGGRIDDLSLVDYHETLDPDSDIVRLLSPVGAPGAYYTLYGWAPGGALGFEDVPGANTEWQIESGTELTPTSPVTLVWDNGNGLVFRRAMSIDDKFMLSVTQSVENSTGSDVRLAPYGIVARHGEPDTVNFFILHEGVVRMSDGELQEIEYGDMEDLDVNAAEAAQVEIIDVAENGWVGFTDKYWMTTLAPAPGQSFRSVAKFVPSANIYQTETRLPTQTVAAGATTEVQTFLFAGAKEWEAIKGYEENLGILGFVDSIDWGWFFFLTKPIFWLLHELNLIIGNMGWSIILLTLIIKAALLPLAWKSYASMAKMKELQPEMEKLKERAGDDRQKMQQEMMQLYKKEKVNPAAGCLPIIMQIPIFFSLYKVIFVTIELRHAPWLGWIRDLSAPDPSSILNLFGLLPYAPPEAGSIFAIVSLGILPIILGISMWMQQKLNPAPTDPTQAMIFAWMPWVFMFMLGSFASGLVLYWIANNTITFVQQYFIMRSHGYKPDIFGNMVSGLRKKSAKKDT